MRKREQDRLARLGANVTRAHAERDAAIYHAVKSGDATLREIADLVGMTHVGVMQTANRVRALVEGDDAEAKR